MKILAAAASLLLCITLAACAPGAAPKVRVATTRLSEAQRAGLDEPGLARALDEAAAASTRADLQERYNAAVDRFVIALQRRVPLSDWNRPIRIVQGDRSWEVTFDNQPVGRQGIPEWSPGLFNRLLPARAFTLSSYDRILRGDGVGVPYVLAFEDIARLRRERRFRPGNGAYVPGTVVLEFGAAPPGAPAPVRMRILNTYTARSARIAGAARPLAYDVTAAIEMSLSNSYIAGSGMPGLLHPGTRLNDIGIFGLTLYDREKIPVLFVHGIKSDVRVWRNAVNEIYADPALAARYQPIFFLYPTGLNITSAAERLRESLRTYQATSDPDRNDPAFNRMILVGHSMGGLLARMQVIDSGDELWQAFSSRPVTALSSVKRSQERVIEKALVFKHQPFVKRVVFVAVPHRGSEIADWRFVRFLLQTVKLPQDAAEFAQRALVEDRSLLNPALLRYHMLGLRSVDMLSPDHPFFAALAKRPILVPYHSIIGDRGRGDSPRSTDGVVPYWSSHLDGAASEKVVPHGHGAVARSEAVREILRILRLHAGTMR
ncbi:MAG: hypothetical protein ABMA01_01770 [Chthoniobacteraceae bacterium]